MKKIEETVSQFGEMIRHNDDVNRPRKEVFTQMEDLVKDCTPSREYLHQWASDIKENIKDLEERKKVLSSQKKVHSSKLSTLEQEEQRIRDEIEAVGAKFGQLLKQRTDIDQQIQILQQERKRISDEITTFGESQSEKEVNLQTHEKKMDNLRIALSQAEEGLAELEQNQELIEGQKKLKSYATWRKGLDLIMDEIEQTREIEWKKWTPRQVVGWICRLDNGEFKKYEKNLLSKADEILTCGGDLTLLDKATWAEMGVSKVK